MMETSCGRKNLGGVPRGAGGGVLGCARGLGAGFTEDGASLPPRSRAPEPRRDAPSFSCGCPTIGRT